MNFNISHAGDYIVIALSNSPDVLLGVDIEQHQPRDFLAIAKRFFTQNEYHYLSQLSEPQLTQDLFHIWTQKEAFVKAIGQGINYSLEAFEVSCTGDVGLVKLDDVPMSE